MKTLNNSNPVALKTIFPVIIFYAAIASGGYFFASLVILNLFFILALLFGKAKWEVDIMALLFGVIFLIMVISWAIGSLSHHQGLTDLLKYSLFPLAYIYFRTYKQDNNSIFYKIFIFIMIFGLLGMVNLSPIPNMVTNLGGRLQSFLGYANTTALLMGIGIFYATEALLNSLNDKSKRRNEKKKMYHAGIALLFLAALIFTLSRVGFVTFVSVYLLYIFRHVNVKIKLAVSAALLGLWGILALADSRIANISIFAPTLVERYISYYDALRMMLMYPLGIGVSNWQFMQFHYQSAPYNVRYIHNFYLQMGLDGGFLALALIIAGCIFALIKGRKNLHFYILLFILTGAFFEVHFNFGLVIVYFSYALSQITKFPSLKLDLPYINRYKYILLLPVIPLCILLTANFYYNTGAGYERGRQRQRAYAAYADSLRLNPLNQSALHFAMARTAPSPETAMEHLRHAHEANPWDTQIIFSLAEGFLHMEDLVSAEYYGIKLLEKFPLNRNNQELLYRILNAGEEPRRQRVLDELQQGIAEIDAGINPLYWHIDNYFRY